MSRQYRLPTTIQPLEELHRSPHTLVLRCEEEQCPVVLKMPVQEQPTSKDMARYQHEYRVLQKLQVQGVVRAHKLMEHHGRPLLVMEDFHGKSLGELLKERTFFVEEGLEILIQAAEALGQLHERGVAHQKISPWNILWEPEEQRLCLIDFAFSKEFAPNEYRNAKHQTYEGSFLYISPEQTGRTKQQVDHRTDFYSLGATAWHLLVGRPPFQVKKPQALIHAHLAERPRALDSFRDDMPAVLSEIVLKLMAKHPDERYQTARGLVADLKRCAEALKKGQVTSFALGQYDRLLEVTTLRRLYGRESELQLLQEKLYLTKTGMEFMLVRGAPGIGKTSLVHSLTEAVHSLQGNFATGRFEQLQKESPYLALQTALRDLLQRLLAEDSPRLLFWQTRIKQVLAQDSALLSPLLPELAHFVGSDMEALQLQPEEERIRLHEAFSALIQALSSPQHPLVLFLDDLQWSDGATLELIKFLVASHNLKGLLLIAGFRETKADNSIPLQEMLESIQQRNIPTTSIVLRALSIDDVQQILVELSRNTLDHVEGLARILWAKTAGNPFFLQILLRQLQQKRLLWLDERGHWSWDQDRSQNLAVTDNVVELLMENLQQQPEESQKALQYAACFGLQFHLSDLMLLLEVDRDQVLHLLLPGINAGLLSRADSSTEGSDAYQFVHDRVHEAAYTLLSEDDRAIIHLQLARLILSQHPNPENTDLLYDVISHLRKGLSQVQDNEERKRCAQLAMAAGEHARDARAFESSFAFLDWGLMALGDNRWQEHYELALSLSHLAVEVGGACRNRERVELYIEELLTYARSLQEQIPAWMAKLYSLLSENRVHEAVVAANRF